MLATLLLELSHGEYQVNGALALTEATLSFREEAFLGEDPGKYPLDGFEAYLAGFRQGLSPQ